MRNDNKYSFIDVVVSIKPLVPNIDLNYFLYILRNELAKTGADYRSKLYFNKIKDYDVSMPIPLDKSGDFDVAAQKDIAEQYTKIKQVKNAVMKELEKNKKHFSRLHVINPTPAK